MARRGLFVPPIVLDRSSGVPLQRQLSTQIAQAIRSGEVPTGSRLPSTRCMAKLLQVSRNTVVAAYDELAADDLVRGVRGAGVHVNRSAPFPDISLRGLRGVLRTARYPARVLPLTDGDGNALYIRF